MTVFVFSHLKWGQEFVFQPGSYFMELYGAQGGYGCQDSEHTTPGGKGSYVSGFISFVNPKKLYLFVGGVGSNGNPIANTSAPGGWNGGGNGGIDTNDNDGSGAGGGATDIREINSSDPMDERSLDSRIIVAAGGSGSLFSFPGAPGGDLTGYTMVIENDVGSFVPSKFTNQTSGNKKGVGGNGGPSIRTPGSGAGGGYYGGIGRPGQIPSIGQPLDCCCGDSGSSYINSNLFGNRKMIVGGNNVSKDGLIKIHYIGANTITTRKKKTRIVGLNFLIMSFGFLGS